MHLIFLIVLLFIRSSVGEDECNPEDPGADVPAHCTHKIAVQLRTSDDSEADRIAQKHGFKNHGQIGGLKGHYLFSHNYTNETEEGKRRKRAASESISADSDIEWLSGQVEKKRVKRGHTQHNHEVTKRQINLPWPDPLYQDQWFLHKGASGGYDMWVTEAWQLGYAGRNVSVSILDDGIQRDHPDLAQNYDPEASTDINDNDSDPMPQDNGDNKHGTRCAGEVAAVAGNQFCGVGVAYLSKIGGVRMLDGPVSDHVEAASLSFHQQHIDIYSASWGPEDDGKTFDGPGPLAKKAFIEGIKTGRGGKGNIFIWASGNGGSHADSCSCDGYTTSIYTLSVSAATFDNRKPWYLEECPSTIATTYSSGSGGQPAIVTTDMPNICTKSHTGTSAAAPMAAGIVALALEANPNLTWRDMQHVVLRTATPDALLANPGWTTNGVGRKISNKFGYGIMNAEALVKLAKVWKTVPEQHSCTIEYKMPNPDPEPLRGKFSLNYTMEVRGCDDPTKSVLYLEQLQVIVTLRFSKRGDLRIFLLSPSGTRSEVLPRRPQDMTSSGFHKWPFLSVQQWGEDPRGLWTLTIENSGSPSNDGTFHGWSLLLYGTSEPAQPGDPLNAGTGAVQTASVLQTNTDISMGAVPDIPEDASHPKGAIVYENCHEECVAENGCTEPNSASGCVMCKNYRQQLRNRGGTKCLSKCDDNYYADPKTMRCNQCLKMCKTCSGPDICDTCHNEQFRVEADFQSFHHGQCLDACPHEFKEDDTDPSNLRCVIACPVSHCASCASKLTCAKCDDGYFLIQNDGYCTALCPPNTVVDKVNRICKKTTSTSPGWLPIIIGACVSVFLLFVLIFACLMCREKDGYRKLEDLDWASDMKEGKNGFPSINHDFDTDTDDETGDDMLFVKH